MSSALLPKIHNAVFDLLFLAAFSRSYSGQCARVLVSLATATQVPVIWIDLIFCQWHV